MQSDIERQVMASVGVIWGAKLLASATAVKLYVLAAAGWVLVQLTWVHMVFQNWAQVGMGRSVQFITYAFLHTHLPVQVAIVVAAGAGLALTVDAVRSLMAPRAGFAH